jgi:hypothetical protein
MSEVDQSRDAVHVNAGRDRLAQVEPISTHRMQGEYGMSRWRTATTPQARLALAGYRLSRASQHNQDGRGLVRPPRLAWCVQSLHAYDIPPVGPDV